MITGRRALLGLPLLAMLPGCAAGSGGGGDVVSVGPASDPPVPVSETSQTPDAVTPQGPGVWADGDPGQCVSLVKGYAPGEAVDLLVGSPVPRFATLDAAMDWAGKGDDRSWGYAGTLDGWTLVWEEMGFRGSLPEVGQRLSRKGEYACTYWNENVGTSFVLARKGRVVRVIGTDHPWNAVGSALPEEAGLGLDSGNDYPSASALLVLLSRVTGTPVVESSWRERGDLQIFGFPF